MLTIVFILYFIGMFGAFLSLTQFDLGDLQGYEKAIPYVLILTWPLVLVWVAILLIYDATIGYYLWKREHKK